MTLVGYPDFQEQAQWQSPPAVTYSAALANGATKIFPTTGNNLFNVSNWAATQMRIFGQFAALDVECQWYDADPPTALLGHRYWTTTANGSDSNVTLPNAGPYLRVNVTNLSGFVPTLVAVIAFTNRITAPFTCPSSGPILYTAPSTVAAAGSATVDAIYLYAGHASLWTATTATAWRIDVNSITSNGVATFVSQMTSTETGVGPLRRVALILPPRPVQLVVHNDGGASADFYASLVPDMFR